MRAQNIQKKKFYFIENKEMQVKKNHNFKLHSLCDFGHAWWHSKFFGEHFAGIKNWLEEGKINKLRLALLWAKRKEW